MEANSNGRAIMERLRGAINAHDLDGLVACFDPLVRSEQPVHPARSFQGRDQVRRNWTQILGAVPDLRATLIGCVTDRDETWSEWYWSGTRIDGTSFEMRGVTVQRLLEGRISSVRFYMEPVDEGATTVADAIRLVAAAR